MEIDLLAHYPRTKRNIQERGATKTDADRALARQFGRDFFDGDRRHGYGGFAYHPRFWQPVIPTIQQHYDLTSQHSLLDVGCAKGFMLHDFSLLIPNITLAGIDISPYAIDNALPSVRPHLQVADALHLPFPDHSFDLVLSINTLHNLTQPDLAIALRELQRVSRRHTFLVVDAYRTDAERDAMLAWNLTAQTILHVDAWKAFFHDVGYTGDYYWFMP